jgi:cold shock CspA family protein
VVLDVPHRHHHSGNLYQVRLDITVPGDEIAVTREAPGHEAAKALAAAIKDAFDAADRLLEDYVRRRRKDVKHLDELPHARVRAVVAGQDHGFLETADGREVYFHRNSLVNADFDSLEPGTEVAFVEEAGEKGPQASTVRVVGRHGHA